MCGCIAYACYQLVQVHALESVVSHISEYLSALKVQHNISLFFFSFLIKHKETRRTAAKRTQKKKSDKGTKQRKDKKKKKSMKENRFTCIQQY